MEASKRADYVKKIHERTREAIEKQGKNVAAAKNQSRKQVLFQPGDMVWVHLRKDRFPELQNSKLKPRGAGLYKVLAKINDNAYSIDIPIAEFGGASNSFNVADLSPYVGDDLGASRSTPFEGGGDDEDIPTTNTSPVHHEEQVDSTKKKDDEIRIGPITRARAKLIEQQVNSLLIDSDILCNENLILPKSLYVCIIRYHDEEEDPEGGEDEGSSNFRTFDTFRTSDIGGQELRRRADLELQKGYGTPTGFERPTRRTSDMKRTFD